MPILDVAIGLSFFYLLLGLICTTVNEMIASWFNTRAKFLDMGVGRLLGGDDVLKKALYNHQLIKSMAPSDKDICPSYLPAEKFATALMDVISGDKPLNDLDAIKTGLKTANTDLQTSIGALMAVSPDAAALHKKIEDWYDQSMDRVTGWYKRNAQRNALLLAIGITLVLNADTVSVVHTLWTNPTMRAAVVESAKQRVAKGAEALPVVEYNDPNDANKPNPVNVPKSPEEGLTVTEQTQLGQLTGWKPEWTILGAAPDKLSAFGGIVWEHWIGWVLTMIAVSLGAPFWFDTLNRFMNIRNAGRAPDEPRDKSNPQPVTT